MFVEFWSLGGRKGGREEGRERERENERKTKTKESKTMIEYERLDRKAPTKTVAP